MPARIFFDKELCTSPEAFQREWLETNGIGGFAASTVTGANTRRYHGLLVAATEPQFGRHVLLSKVEETLVVGGERLELSSNLYPGVTHPAGYRFLTGFRLDPFPVFTFEVGGVILEKRFFLAAGENTLVLRYERLSGPACQLELRPLVAFRGYHELQSSLVQPWNTALTETAGRLSFQPRPGVPALHFAHAAQRIERAGNWYFNFEYPIERERGFDHHEDLYNPFALHCDLPATLIVSTENHTLDDAPALKARELARRQNLSAAADQYIVRSSSHNGGHTILAGYPWFGEWSRDTLISLPGLTLVNGRFDVAREIFIDCIRWLDQGMLPNRFPDDGTPPEYNTADATLWLFEAVRKYLACTGDLPFIRDHLYAPLLDIIDHHARGTRFGIGMDTDGLLSAGDATTQLTWMDARVNGQPVTPRHGKAVEIQALWYNALRITANLGAEVGHLAAQRHFDAMADRTGDSLATTFWNEPAGCLFDVEGDPSIRPNQLLALSLGYCAIGARHAQSILRVVDEKLLTPYGLRTLAPDDPRYCGRYEGPASARDSAYHQGTVWPWLLGPYITAQSRFNGESGRQRGAAILHTLRDFVESRGTGQMPEIFDGDAPHYPRGCFAQAWSVAELERVAAECFAGDYEPPGGYA